ncbi:MAG: cation-translocating P-type ATPase [Magnetovibrio sp.]|nr:cation-translocating P-type ATPase [Magnetovibrio sp.]
MTTFPDHPPNWHALSCDDAAARLTTDPRRGLSEQAARQRLQEVGENRLDEPPTTPAWVVFARQFTGVLSLVLVVASLLALWIGEHIDAAAIFVVLIINGGLGFIQERRAERALAALKTMLAKQATVRRDGGERQVPASELVPGDIAVIATGDRIPADGRLIRAVGLEIDESVLTGESVAVAKDETALADDGLPLGDRRNMAYTNTVVTRGRGEMLVTATGMSTETGRLADLLAATEESTTPLQDQLDRLGKRLAAIAVGVVAVILGIALLQGRPVSEAMLTAIALAVAAVPEGLPAVVTVTLALGMQRMARRGAIVKRLAAVETLGCASVVCSDKTGTLSLNRMTARTLFFRGKRLDVPTGQSGAGITGAGPEIERLLIPMALCNDSRLDNGEVIGDPTEGALLAVCAMAGMTPEPLVERLPRIGEVPFDSANKYMATFHRTGDTVQEFVKGAPDIIIGRCSHLAGEDGDVDIDAAVRDALMHQNDTLAADALRVIAIAAKRMSVDEFEARQDLTEHVDGLVLLGLIGMADPVRPEVKTAIDLCREAGIDVKMITGDHRGTAAAIADQLGLEGEVVLGVDVDAMDAETLESRIEAIGVFARVAPENKMRIVEALRTKGHVVAMTGDGVNDAPALKSADIGMAMGRAGTEVTKEAATMVLTDDNFSTIVDAIQEGRTIYTNIVKFVRYQLSTNLGALLTVFAATVMGLPMPFSPLQLLWVNVIMDGPPAMALGVDPMSEGQMKQKPRRKSDQILTLRRFWVLCYLGAVMATGTLGVFLWGLETGDNERAVTLAFTTFVLFHIANAFNARSETESLFSRQFMSNPSLWLSLACVLCLQVIAVNWPPAQAVMHTVSLAPADWAAATAVAASILVVEEARKLLLRRLPRANAAKAS